MRYVVVVFHHKISFEDMNCIADDWALHWAGAHVLAGYLDREFVGELRERVGNLPSVVYVDVSFVPGMSNEES